MQVVHMFYKVTANIYYVSFVIDMPLKVIYSVSTSTNEKAP